MFGQRVRISARRPHGDSFKNRSAVSNVAPPHISKENSPACRAAYVEAMARSEEHTSELQSLRHLVCRLLLEKKKRPAHPQDNGRHERMHRTLKQQTALPALANLLQQQEQFDALADEYNAERPHETVGRPRTP